MNDFNFLDKVILQNPKDNLQMKYLVTKPKINPDSDKIEITEADVNWRITEESKVLEVSPSEIVKLSLESRSSDPTSIKKTIERTFDDSAPFTFD